MFAARGDATRREAGPDHAQIRSQARDDDRPSVRKLAFVLSRRALSQVSLQRRRAEPGVRSTKKDPKEPRVRRSVAGAEAPAPISSAGSRY